MKNAELRTIIENIIENRAVEGASVKITQHGNGYYTCVRAPHTAYEWNGNTHTEYSLPEGFVVWGIQGKARVRKIVNEFFDSHGYLTRQ